MTGESAVSASPYNHYHDTPASLENNVTPMSTSSVPRMNQETGQSPVLLANTHPSSSTPY
eukprot:CAMPEP_0182436196 /NCGR_PEP_ID=MMETSP1167-20130531/80224_1 /TAXON_ID=2988 /ORGANISM="Mallomonas Sp, Strain CCMP3275" /LENGTH=59 /DNA_ID=CAMNT_0024628091 /DNA_START=19 /DNA_END=195 /DNA_ORIENTATION=-